MYATPASVRPETDFLFDHRAAAKLLAFGQSPHLAVSAPNRVIPSRPLTHVAQRKKPLDAEKNLLTHEVGAQAVSDEAQEQASANTPPTQNAVLYTQASTATVTDAGAAPAANGANTAKDGLHNPCPSAS